MNLEAERNRLVAKRKIEKVLEIIDNNEFERLDAVEISDFVDAMEDVQDEELREEFSTRANEIKEIFIDNGNELTEESLDRAVRNLEALRSRIVRIDTVRRSNAASAKNKDAIRKMEERYREEYHAENNEEFLREQTGHMGDRTYSENDIDGMSYYELAGLVDAIKTRGQGVAPSEELADDNVITNDNAIEDDNVIEEPVRDEPIPEEIATDLEEDERELEEINRPEIVPATEFIRDDEELEEVVEEELEEALEDEIDIDALKEEYKDVEKQIMGYINDNKEKLNKLKNHKERLEEEKNNVSPDEPSAKSIVEEYDKQIAETEIAIRKMVNPDKEEQLRIREEKDALYRLATSKIQKLEGLISEVKKENRKLEFDYNEMVYEGIKDYTAFNRLKNKIDENNYKIREMEELIENYSELKEELRKTEKTIDIDELHDPNYGKDDDNVTPPTGDDTDNNEDNNDAEDNTEDLDDDFDNTITGGIKELVDALDPENMTPEQIESLLSKIEQLVVLQYNKDQALFENNLANAKTVNEKLDLIQARENEMIKYIQMVSSEIKEKDDLLNETRNKIANYITTSYETSKANGEYCWKEFKNVKQSKDYIISVIGADKDWNEQLATLLDNMEEIIKNPDQEQYENWRAGMQQYAEKIGLDPVKMNPYMNARAKVVNPAVSVDNEFNLHGLNLENGKNKGDGDNIPKKPRKKVTGVEKNPGFFKRHPKLKLLAIGLAIALGSQLGAAGLMMINSSLWTALGGQGAICGALHAINLGLSKIVGVGLFQFTQAGTYTFLGGEGALALYSAVGAKITAALAGLGGIGAIVARKIKGKNAGPIARLKEKFGKEAREKRKAEKEEQKELEQAQEEQLIKTTYDAINKVVEEGMDVDLAYDKMYEYLINSGYSKKYANYILDQVEERFELEEENLEEEIEEVRGRSR